ncbi:MAG: hypothetical protein OXT74_09835, partial [Candidatus Poribacteria bacterium]|nr:hypothetical protein [Candidatus Poribacteria bacterium]
LLNAGAQCAPYKCTFQTGVKLHTDCGTEECHDPQACVIISCNDYKANYVHDSVNKLEVKTGGRNPESSG